MDESLDRHVHSGRNLGYLPDAKFAGDDNLGKSRRRKESCLVRRPRINLGAGMDGYGRQIHLHDAHVLHNDGIDTGMIEVAYHLPHVIQLVIIDYGIDRHIDLGVINVCKCGQLTDVVYRVGRCHPCPMRRSAYIDGICTVAYGFDAAHLVACRGEEFDFYRFVVFHFFIR